MKFLASLFFGLAVSAFAGGTYTGSFSGTFSGNGSGLTNVNAASLQGVSFIQSVINSTNITGLNITNTIQVSGANLTFLNGTNWAWDSAYTVPVNGSRINGAYTNATCFIGFDQHAADTLYNHWLIGTNGATSANLADGIVSNVFCYSSSGPTNASAAWTINTAGQGHGIPSMTTAPTVAYFFYNITNFPALPFGINNVIYCDGVGGNDSNNGLTPFTPVQDFDTAYLLCPVGGTIYIPPGNTILFGVTPATTNIIAGGVGGIVQAKPINIYMPLATIQFTNAVEISCAANLNVWGGTFSLPTIYTGVGYSQQIVGNTLGIAVQDNFYGVTFSATPMQVTIFSDQGATIGWPVGASMNFTACSFQSGAEDFEVSRGGSSWTFNSCTLDADGGTNNGPNYTNGLGYTRCWEATGATVTFNNCVFGFTGPGTNFATAVWQTEGWANINNCIFNGTNSNGILPDVFAANLQTNYLFGALPITYTNVFGSSDVTIYNGVSYTNGFGYLAPLYTNNAGVY